MTKDIGDFDMDEAQSVYQKALRRAEIKYFNGDKVKLENVMASNGSIRAVAARVQGKEYDGELDDFAESINEILAQEIYISVKEGGEGRSFWPVIFPDSAEGRQYQYSVGPPTNREAPLVPNLARCELRRDGDKYVADSIQESLFLASDSEHLFTSEGGNHLIWTQHFNSNLEVWVGVPVAKGRATGSLGAGRCDSVDEVDYRWLGNFDLGIALGLSRDRFLLPAEELPGNALHWLIHALEEQKYFMSNFPDGSEILYFKNFKTDGTERKNRPGTVFFKPLVFPWQFKFFFNNNDEFKFATRKKVKAPLTFNKNSRKSAAETMRQELRPLTKTFRLTVIYSEFNAQGSAKSLAEAITTGGRGDLDISQEWCHLLGHGDGGEETASNFISGSKHCNSEQLAIEEGQRIWSRHKDSSFSAHITTYRFPLASNQEGEGVEKVFTEFVKLESRIPFPGRQPPEPRFDSEEPKHIAAILKEYKLLVRTEIKDKNSPYTLYLPRKIHFFRSNRGSYTVNFDHGFLVKYERLCVMIKCDERSSLPNISELWRNTLEWLEKSYLENLYPHEMRYKIILKPKGLLGGSPSKVFDHVYHAQSQSFNYHEFKILRTTVDRLLAVALKKQDDYVSRIQKKSEGYRIGKYEFRRRRSGSVEIEVYDASA